MTYIGWFALMFTALIPSAFSGVPGREITDTRVLSISPCTADGWVEIELEVTGDSVGWTIELNGAGGLTRFLYEDTPTLVTHRAFASGALETLRFRGIQAPSSSRLTIALPNPSFDLDVEMPLCPGSCAITDVTFVELSPCGPDGLAEAVFDIHTRSPAAPGDPIQLKLVDGADFFSVDTVLTTNPTRVSVPFIADGRPSPGLIVYHDVVACTYTDRIPGNLPTCASDCGAALLSLAPSACDADDNLEVVSHFAITPPFSNASVSVSLSGNRNAYTDTRPARDGAMSFTNRVYGSGRALDLEVEFGTTPTDGRTLTLRERLAHVACAVNPIPFQLPKCTCDILQITAVPQPCFNGAVPVEVTVESFRPPAGGQLTIKTWSTNRFDDSGLPFAVFPDDPEPRFIDSRTEVLVSDSPQTVTVYLPPNSGSWDIEAELSRKEGNSTHVICQDEVPLTITEDCPIPACDVSRLRLTAITPCRAGVVNVSVQCDIGPGHNPREPVHFRSVLDTGSGIMRRTITVEPGTATTAQVTFQHMNNGRLTLELSNAADDDCQEAIGPFTINCSTPACQIDGITLTGASPCVDGDMYLHFDLQTTGALGSTFDFGYRVENGSSFSGTFAPDVVITNDTTAFSLRIVPSGGLIDQLRVQQILYQNGVRMHNPDCLAIFNNVARIPDCFGPPEGCLIEPPQIVATRCGSYAPSDTPYIDFTLDVPPETDFVVESADSVDGPWTEVQASIHRVGGAKKALVTIPNPHHFYRVRCEDIFIDGQINTLDSIMP